MTIIAHATDLTGDDRSAFIHASALAAASAARLVSVHGNAPADQAERLPDVAPLAARWGRAITHERRCHECCDDVTDTLLDALTQLQPQLVVTGTHARHGLAAIMRGSVSMAVARNLTVPTLVIPNQGRPFVDDTTGAIVLERVLLPAGDPAELAAGLAATRALAALIGAAPVAVTVLHVGDSPLTVEAGVTLRRADGDLERAIAAAVRSIDPCLVVMPSHGHDGVLDALLGSHTDHVVRDAGCPVLVVPVARG
ncbi:MAG: universal stress protein [Kofleriaceae bacterium]